MARIIPEDESPFNDKPEYPWDLWLDGRVWEIGFEDVPTVTTGKLQHLAIFISTGARRRGQRVRTLRNTKKQTVTFQAEDGAYHSIRKRGFK